MSEKKVVRRNVAIALGIICIVLTMGLIGAILGLQNQVNDLNSTLNLDKSTVWISDQTLEQPANFYTNWAPGFSASYCGYVSVRVTSTTTNTYVRIIYTSYGANCDNQIVVGTNGTAVFPVLPSSSIEIRVGNTNFNGANETVTITYHY
jgi:hypothetical protein